ncbi:glutamate--cysteine ligase [Thermopolyspora sp. NPDC052614]|uniref:glutamate--cysteine ligase n=1 Tax=Thermopolyspora sp. NPDC052614 TaxID=3155682 RepID=UPI00341B6206
MGKDLDKEHFSEAEFARFGERLEHSLAALRELLDRPGFGAGPPTIGAELELFLVTPDGRPLKRNKAVRETVGDDRVALELGAYNIEVNLTPRPLAGRPFADLAAELREVMLAVDEAAAPEGGGQVPIGILPTLREFDFTGDAMTNERRYRALSRGIRRVRAEPFFVTISGAERLDLRVVDVILESANTSWQIHLRTPPADFARVYNAAQLATAPVLAVSGNSPLFLGRRLWEETRIALFEESADDRDEERPWRREGRVHFGPDWVRHGAEELFAWGVREFEPLLPVLDDEEDPLDVVRRGGVPRLDELRTHQGTVWQWNRPVYDPADGGHLRVEMRALPSGPSVPDMTANAAFLLGLVVELAEREPEGFAFAEAYRNFYRAARDGLAARLFWPGHEEEVPAPALVRELVPLARAGLERSGVEPADADAALEVIRWRAETGRTGARWQREAITALGNDPMSWAQMVNRYRELALTHRPVHTWPPLSA